MPRLHQGLSAHPAKQSIHIPLHRFENLIRNPQIKHQLLRGYLICNYLQLLQINAKRTCQATQDLYCSQLESNSTILTSSTTPSKQQRYQFMLLDLISSKNSSNPFIERSLRTLHTFISPGTIGYSGCPLQLEKTRACYSADSTPS